MEESDNELLEETDEGNELRPRSPIRKKKDNEKQHKLPRIIRSPRATNLSGSGRFSIIYKLYVLIKAVTSINWHLANPFSQSTFTLQDIHIITLSFEV